MTPRITPRTVVARGVRLGALVGAWPAGIGAILCLIASFVFLTGGQQGTARALLVAAAYAVLGSMAVGLTLGTATGLTLALAPRRLLARPLLRGLLAGITAALPVALVSIAALTGDGYTLASYPPSIHLLTWTATLTIAFVAAARSGEIAGCGTSADRP
ncbi:hypothetical protein [Streptomyces sp. 3214.6]|uniref:hypothetical protein n=1 Tax=Streptomyces sp. 3214.6 TaxID=1882757 RepID=UPI00090B0356|nr:hypothetical protein [Streptomyces sp. 3214.6]SHI19943.1 hypothetical protein SAMN05444521_5248 [Streptomyces sp. 3214.6]